MTSINLWFYPLSCIFVSQHHPIDWLWLSFTVTWCHSSCHRDLKCISWAAHKHCICEHRMNANMTRRNPSEISGVPVSELIDHLLYLFFLTWCSIKSQKLWYVSFAARKVFTFFLQTDKSWIFLIFRIQAENAAFFSSICWTDIKRKCTF